jgi:hypothetical protein
VKHGNVPTDQHKRRRLQAGKTQTGYQRGAGAGHAVLTEDNKIVETRV